MAANNDAEEFAAAASSALPAEAVAITGWRELTTLVYFQEVHGERADERFVLPARTLRYYSHGTVADYVSLVRDVICEYPVYTTKELTDLGEEYRVTDVGADPWRQVQLKDSAQGGC